MLIALLHYDNEELLIEGIIDLAYPTHNNSSAIATICAVGFAIAESIQVDASINSILEKAIKGAKSEYKKIVEESLIAVASKFEK